MALDHEAGVGERIAYYRRRRGMTQSVLAGLVGRGEEWLSQIERGARSVERLTVIVEVAEALRIEPAALLPPPFASAPRRVGAGAGAAATTRELGTAPDAVPALRRVLMRPPGARDSEPPPELAALRRRIQWAFRCSQTERWSELGPELPGLLAQAHAASQHAPEDPDAQGLLSLGYRVTSGMLDRLGEPHLPWIAAERAAVAAEQSGDPLLVGGAAWRWSVVLRHAGELDAALEVPAVAAEALVRDPGAVTDPRALSVHGALLLKAAVGAASLDDRRGVDEYLSRAEQVADQVGERNHFWFAFGPLNVQIHRVWLANELGHPAEALEHARTVEDERLPPHLAERRTSHLVAVAWAHYLRRDDDAAVAALGQARRHAPEQLLLTRRVRDMTATMLRRDRRSRRGLRALAGFLDLP